ncbi:hypothetical protein [Tolypothrix sp. PCC 7601]|uniref:hypothetical protein n=1 Tax=Tolypothrix sp. PCC 7601 TaxID=1188 RepID=UPI0021E0664E|nr:hypothetical protein [Tolypothrix sp. PCC 7601]UYD38980.1 hypothetical protein HG267_41415 [Tolypothrix sp. PCC 7601]
MPSYTRNVARDQLVFVACNTKILYGFKTKDLASLSGVSSSDLTALGHLTSSAAMGQSGKIYVVGASAPKPPRVNKKLSNAAVGTQKSISTYCAKTALGAALTAGWNISKNGHGVTLQAASASSGSLTAIATLSDGSKYCFPMNKADFDAHGAALGLEASTAITSTSEKDSLVRGSSKPKPGRVSKKTSGGGTFSSFFSTGTDVAQAGYNITEEEIVIVGASNSSP